MELDLGLGTLEKISYSITPPFDARFYAEGEEEDTILLFNISIAHYHPLLTTYFIPRVSAFLRCYPADNSL